MHVGDEDAARVGQKGRTVRGSYIRRQQVQSCSRSLQHGTSKAKDVRVLCTIACSMAREHVHLAVQKVQALLRSCASL